MTRTIPIPLMLALLLAACSDDNSAAPDPEPEMMGMPDAGTPDAGEGDADMPDPEPDPQPEGEVCELQDIADAPGLVATERGFVQGVEVEDAWAWRGIPFAAPPVDGLRWKPTEPAACWDGVLETAAFGPECPQTQITAQGVQLVGAEDCLTLNVWSPVDGSDGEARPVLFFIHGGGNIVGSASQELSPGKATYDGRRLAARGDAIVVTTQYRLGPLGFLSTPELDAESETGTSGNYAHMDQVAALEWVRDNIGAFGGDPSRVMVFGESAGAVNTCTMVSTPLAEGLFHAALMQSGACTTTPKEVTQRSSAQAAELAGCDDAEDVLACMRDVDAKELVRVASGSVGIGDSPTENGLRWGPTIDGHVLLQNSFETFEMGAHNKVPLVIGSNADEMASQQINRVEVDSAEDYEPTVRVVFGAFGADAVERILETYPVDDYESANDAFIQILTDATFTCPTQRVARAVTEGQDESVYRYFFSRRFETQRGEGRARHGIELVYVFGTLEDIQGFQPAQGDLNVSASMMDAWLEFAATGEPSADGAWPAYDLESETSFVFEDPTATEDKVRADKCALWDDLLGIEGE